MTRPVSFAAPEYFDVLEIEARARAMRAAHINAMFASLVARLRRVRLHGAAARA